MDQMGQFWNVLDLIGINPNLRGGLWNLPYWFSHNSIDDRIYCSMDSKTRRFNPRLGQKSNPIRLKNWKIIMQSKVGTIGSTIQTLTWFKNGFLHSLLIQTENHTISTSFRAVFSISSLSARYSQLATTACVQITTRVAGTTSQTPWRK